MFLTYAKSISCANSRHNRDRKLDLTQNLILNVFQSPNRLDIDITKKPSSMAPKDAEQKTSRRNHPISAA